MLPAACEAPPWLLSRRCDGGRGATAGRPWRCITILSPCGGSVLVGQAADWMASCAPRGKGSAVTVFGAMDVETANPDVASICEVGFVAFEGSEQVFEFSTLINPEDWFSFFNVGLHGINDELVANAPTFPFLAQHMFPVIEGHLLVSHSPFDRVAIERACEKYELQPPEVTWLDTAKVARRAWQERARSGYNLASVCAMLGYEFDHHDALSDAKAAAFVLLAACDATGMTIEDWLERVAKRTPRKRERISAGLEPNPDGPLVGEVIVFTGALEMPRREAAVCAGDMGCRVTDGVTKHTTLLVVGDQDIARLAGHEKSAKHRKAEELMAKGQRLRIVGESDFMELVRLEG